MEAIADKTNTIKKDIMSLSQKSTDLKRRRIREALRGGGEKAIEQNLRRERIIALLDPKSFHEYDLFVEHAGRDFDMSEKYLPGDGVVTGTGTNGYAICVFAQDFTVAGGSLGYMHAKKITKIMDHAMKLKVPLIGINDSGGARIRRVLIPWQVMVKFFTETLNPQVLIPQISVILGPCAGRSCLFSCPYRLRFCGR